MVQSLLSYQATNVLKHSHASKTEGLRVMFLWESNSQGDVSISQENQWKPY